MVLHYHFSCTASLRAIAKFPFSRQILQIRRFRVAFDYRSFPPSSPVLNEKRKNCHFKKYYMRVCLSFKKRHVRVNNNLLKEENLRTFHGCVLNHDDHKQRNSQAALGHYYSWICRPL